MFTSSYKNEEKQDGYDKKFILHILPAQPILLILLTLHLAGTEEKQDGQDKRIDRIGFAAEHLYGTEM
jgi:hypothetical protein